MLSGNLYKYNKYSQFGEDGIIKHFLNLIPEPSKYVVEFGASDGLSFSNTASLWTTGGYEALLIEADRERYENLSEHHNDLVKTVHATVTNIDDFTTRQADVCSIDIDGDDYHVFDRMQTSHHIVLVEHNPTVPPHLRMVNRLGESTGSSARSLVELAESKGYTLVGATTSNMIFFYDFPLKSAYVTDLDSLFDYSCLNYVVTDYQGHYQFVGRWPYGMTTEKDLDCGY